MQHQPIQVEHERRNLIANGLGGMEMPGVKGQQDFPADCVGQVELHRTGRVTLEAHAEKLGFDRVQVKARVDLFGQDGIQ